MQRSASGRSSYESAWGRPRMVSLRPAAMRSALFCPSGVMAGYRPLGDDQRRALRTYNLVAAVPPELVVGGSPGNTPAPTGPPWGDSAFRTKRGITRLMGLAGRFDILCVAILPAVFALFPGRRFLVGGEKLLRSQF